MQESVQHADIHDFNLVCIIIIIIIIVVLLSHINAYLRSCNKIAIIKMLHLLSFLKFLLHNGTKSILWLLTNLKEGAVF